METGQLPQISLRMLEDGLLLAPGPQWFHPQEQQQPSLQPPSGWWIR
jgi:hypothetical protein